MVLYGLFTHDPFFLFSLIFCPTDGAKIEKASPLDFHTSWFVAMSGQCLTHASKSFQKVDYEGIIFRKIT